MPTKAPTAAPTIWDGFAEGSDRVETQDGDLPQVSVLSIENFTVTFRANPAHTLTHTLLPYQHMFFSAQEAAIAGASIGAGVIAVIIVAVCCAGSIIVAALFFGGVFIARKTMLTLDRRELGGEIVETTGIPRGTEFTPDPEWVHTRLELEEQKNAPGGTTAVAPTMQI